MLVRGSRARLSAAALAFALGHAGCGKVEPVPVALAACPEGQIALDAATCMPVGVPAIACASGFEPADAGCTAVLPAAPCGDGLSALPGDDACHELASCGDGTWGDIPVEADTQHVDTAYGATDSDGSAERPWRTIAQAVDAAAPGAIVAVAAGSYVEHVLIAGKPVRLWGRCPRLVEIAGPGVTYYAAIEIESGADGTELRGLAVRGPRLGLSASGSLELGFADLWIHDTGDIGLGVDDYVGSASATIQNVLVERATRGGVYGAGAGTVVDLEDVLVRDTQPESDGQFGHGIAIEPRNYGMPGGTGEIRHSVVEGSHTVGIVSTDSSLTLEGTLVRDTQPRAADGSLGRGIAVQGGSATIRSCVVERIYEFGIDALKGATVLVESTVVRDTKSELSSARRGGALGSYQADVVARGCLLERSQAFGIGVLDGTLSVERTLVRETAPSDDGLLGDGVVVVSNGQEASVEAWASAIETSARAGIASFGTAVELDHVLFGCNQIQLDGEVFAQRSFDFVDLGGNVCSCGTSTETCQAVSAQLAPPSIPEQ